jgi:hypothetical protein
MEVAGRHILLRGIKRARQWHVLIRVGIATAVVAAVTAFQLPLEADVPGEPFLLYFIVAVASAAALFHEDTLCHFEGQGTRDRFGTITG